MTRRDARHLLLGTALCAALPLTAYVPQDDQVFKSGAELVVLHASVFDKKGNAVAGLPQNAFTVYEDGRPQDIGFFNGGDVPVSIGLVVDNSSSMIAERAVVDAGVSAFIDSSHPDDEMFAIIFNERIRLGLTPPTQFTTDRQLLRDSLNRFRPGGRTAFYDAVIAGVNHLEHDARYQKRVLVVLSDGGDNASVYSEKEMLDRVSGSSVIIYTVIDPNVVAPGESKPGVLRRLARLSGGIAYFSKTTEDLVEDFQAIAGNIRQGYSIGYLPPSTPHHHDQHHDIKVTVKAPGRSNLSVRVRSGYTEHETSDAP